MLKARVLEALPALRHGFFTRRGGVSRGLYGSLNGGFGSRDERTAVAENRRRAVARLGGGGAPLCTLYQCHSADCITVTAPWPAGETPRADAMVTDRADIVLGIMTADCAPVLLADSEAHVIGAAHAGWKGALGGIIEATVEAMVALGASPGAISAAVGPCIGWESYEVGAEFRAAFLDADDAYDEFFKGAVRDGHYQFDLAGFIAARLAGLDLGAVDVLPFDTYGDAQRFFSYRRACHGGEDDYGRLLSLIRMEP